MSTTVADPLSPPFSEARLTTISLFVFRKKKKEMVENALFVTDVRLGSHYAIHSGSGTGGRSNLWRSIGRGIGGTSHNNATVTIFSNVYFLQVPI